MYTPVLSFLLAIITDALLGLSGGLVAVNGRGEV